MTNLNPTTLTAVRGLVDAITAHPEDLRLMKVYGNLPQHLLDLVSDFEDDLTNEEVA